MRYEWLHLMRYGYFCSIFAGMKLLRTIRQSPFYDVLLFALITVGCHLLWRLGRGWFEHTASYAAMADFTSHLVYRWSAWLTDRLPLIDSLRDDALCVLTFGNGRAIVVDHSCSGLKQFYQAFFLFLLYPGPWQRKLWYIPLALLVMHLTNVFRIIGLSYTMAHAPAHWDFVHDWVLRPFFYVVLFGLWVLWNEKIRK